MQQRSLIEQPYTGGPYQHIATDLHGSNGPQHLSLTLLEGGASWRSEQDAWHHPQPSCDRLFIFTEGHADIDTQYGHQRLDTGTIHLLPEGLPFTITYSANSRLYFQHLRILDTIKLPFFRHALNIRHLQAPRLLADLCRATDKHNNTLLLSRSFECILRLAEQVESVAHGADTRFAVLFDYLDVNLDADTRIAELASVMDMHTSALSKAFQRSIGVSLKHYLQTRLMDRAKQALLFSSASIETVAADLGYKDPFYFSRAFKRHCGSSPSTFRQMNREGDG